ncbi:hypothetical protein [Nostoc punctiforme]|uniref:hypothetical protein n=1 Tax=Nostoc punctiforme TaxID=272131 RepID=UPI000045BDC8|nr:hypothetical protein [Nostoc punctiforme]
MGKKAIADFPGTAIVLFLLVSSLCFQHNTLTLELAKPYKNARVVKLARVDFS